MLTKHLKSIPLLLAGIASAAQLGPTIAKAADPLVIRPAVYRSADEAATVQPVRYGYRGGYHRGYGYGGYRGWGGYRPYYGYGGYGPGFYGRYGYGYPAYGYGYAYTPYSYGYAPYGYYRYPGVGIGTW